MQSLGAAIAVPTLVRAANRIARMPIAFSTLGCPRWGWRTILDRAAEWGYAAVELRGIQGELDLTQRPEFIGTQLGTSLKEVEAAGLRISDLGSSAKLHLVDPAARAKQLDEGRRFIDLAHRMGVPYVRVFGDQIVADQPKQASVERVIAGLRELGAHAKGSGVAVILESHGDFCDSPTLLRIMEGAAMPTVGLLWDTHHTVVAGKEAPADTFRHLRRYVRHTHLKDSIPEGKDVRYVLTGSGTVPLREIVRTLVTHQYTGYFCLEWEKLWHPEIEDPEVAFPQYASTMGRWLREAGLKPR